MSLSSKRGKDFELRVAKAIRRKLGTKAARDSRSGAGWFKADIRLPGQEFFIEAKSQETLKLRDWWADVEAKCGYKTPVLVVDHNGYQEWAVMRLDDMLNLVKIIADDTATIRELRQ